MNLLVIFKDVKVHGLMLLVVALLEALLMIRIMYVQQVLKKIIEAMIDLKMENLIFLSIILILLT